MVKKFINFFQNSLSWKEIKMPVKGKKSRKKESKKNNKTFPFFSFILYLSFFCAVIITILTIGGIYYFEKTYQKKIYPGIKIDNVSFGGKTKKEVEDYFLQKSKPFKKLGFILTFEDKIATISAGQLDVSFDEKLAAEQSFSIGRTGNLFSDTYHKSKAAALGINLQSVFKINTEFIDEILASLGESIDVLAENALFQFEKGKVTAFKLSKPGRKLNQEKVKKTILSYIQELEKQSQFDLQTISIELPVETVSPSITTENSNDLGIKELLAVGTSKFAGSIAGRIHNIVLASSRMSGHLVTPDTVFSFNDALGDVSTSTGFQPAYIIKGGRTVLGDGGGVCQVSTTLFRAAINTGLPIIERHPHSYRVSYYEQQSSPGIDATVFAPSYDLKFKNDTGNYLLIQAKSDPKHYILVFEIYGTSDGRKIEITKPVIHSQIAPPPDLYQDDPTLPKGVVKQIDWKAWGAKVSFDYKVTKNEEVLFKKTFFSNFRPWQAVFLKGTKE